MNKTCFKRIVMLFVMLVLFGMATAETLIIEKDPLRLAVYDYSGGICLYIKNSETEEYVPLFSVADEAYTSGFYLKYGKTSRKLTRSAGVSVSVAEIDSGAEVTYTLSGTASVVIKYTLLAAVNKQVADCVRVDVTVENLGKLSDTFAIKSVFDTMLGEFEGNHFITAMPEPYNTEHMFQSMIDAKWVRSSDGTDSIQFLLNGGDVSTPQYVALANRDLLLSSSWVPVVTEGRYFDSIRMTGNSAVGIYWRDVQLKSQTKSYFTFYITAATASLVPPDIKTVCGNLSDELAHITVYSEPVYVDSHGTTFTVGELSEEQLDPDYIAELFGRIQELENSEGSSTFYDEIQKLNGELDAILLKLEEMGTDN